MAAQHSLFNPRWLNGEYRPDIIAYYDKQWNDFRMGFHTHEMNEIMYVISGVCKVDTEDQTIAMRKGDLILLDSGTSHRLIVEEGPCRMLNVEFTFTD
jgi:mannose-6-phosphate isomerase-like protein (cupin superfamily)